MAPPTKFKFQDGERVLCFHGPLLYEAKTIRTQQKDKLIRYFVHYQGWNKNWDEWVPESRVLKYNEENVEKQKDLMEQHETNKANKKKRQNDEMSSATSGRGSPALVASTGAKTTRAAAGTGDGPSSSKKKIKVEPSVETEAQYTKKVEVKIKIPDEIKSWLVDDWDYITRQKKLVNLPAATNIDAILDAYADTKKGNKVKESQVVEVVNGIREYFNAMLGCQLLYKFERPQYQRLQREAKNEDDMCRVYGVIHLLRLFTKLGQMLVYTDLEEKDMTLLVGHLQDFLKYIVKSNYFSPSDYIVATPDYHRKTL